MRALIWAWLALVLIVPLAHAGSNPDAVAVVIGNKIYARAPEIAFADRDAQAMKRYVIDVLGYDEGNVITVENATLGRMIGLFGTEANPHAQLARRLGVTASDSDVFVYYSGHGFPGLHDHKGYLLPVDADPREAEDTAYSLDLLTKNLAELGARSVTLVLEACFSGDSAAGPVVAGVSSLVRPAEPTAAPPHVTVLAAAGPSEMANWDKPDRHGAFTEFFLRAVYGEADDPAYGGKQDGRITAAAVKAFLDRKMSRWTARELDSEQTASLSGDGDVALAILAPGVRPKRQDLAPPPATPPVTKAAIVVPPVPAVPPPSPAPATPAVVVPHIVKPPPPAPPAPGPGLTISGTWTGLYHYPAGGQRPVQFQVVFQNRGQQLTGRSQEPNTFGQAGVPYLYANVRGSLFADGSVRFIKTYDGTGQVSHSVEYAGTINYSTGTIAGTWSITGSNGQTTTGLFEIRKNAE